MGLITPPNPAQEFERDGDPFGVAYGSDGAFWFTLSGAEPTVLPGAERVTSTGEHTYLGGVKPENSSLARSPQARTTRCG